MIKILEHLNKINEEKIINICPNCNTPNYSFGADHCPNCGKSYNISVYSDFSHNNSSSNDNTKHNNNNNNKKRNKPFNFNFDISISDENNETMSINIVITDKNMECNYNIVVLKTHANDGYESNYEKLIQIINDYYNNKSGDKIKILNNIISTLKGNIIKSNTIISGTIENKRYCSIEDFNNYMKKVYKSFNGL